MAPGAPGPVDVFVDGQKVFSNITLQTVSELQSLAPGQKQVKVTVAGQTDPAVTQADVTVVADQTAETIITGAPGDVRLQVAMDDLRQSPEGRGLLRFVNTVPNVGRVDVFDQNGGQLFDNVDFRQVTDFRDVPAGTYTLSVRLDNTNNTILTIPNVTVPSRGTASAFTTGQAAGVPVQQQPGAPPAAQQPGALPVTGTGGLLTTDTPLSASLLLALMFSVLVGGTTLLMVARRRESGASRA